MVKGQIDKSFRGENVTLILVEKDTDLITKNDLGHIDQSTINIDGSYIFKFRFYGDIDDYELKIRLGGEIITDSVITTTASYSWIDAGVKILQYNNIISGEVIINNYYDIEGLTYRICLAFYDDNNRLIGISTIDNIIGDRITIDNLQAELPFETAFVKSIVLSTFSQMVPLCDYDMKYVR